MSTTERKARERRQRERAFLDAALALLDRDDWQAVTVEQIAERAEYAKGTPRGLATTEAILGYVGRPFAMRLDGTWRTVHGWQSLRRERYPGAGVRWLARCEVPDLGLLPSRYPQLRTCDFRAGLELRRMHFGLWLASWAVRAGLPRSLRPWAGTLLRLSERWLDAGSDIGTRNPAVRLS